jgi:hypothetical protein
MKATKDFTRRVRRMLPLLAVLGVASAAPAQPAGQNGGTREAINVHGHWVMEVRNPDGTLAERREFDNALAPGGGALLAQWLTRQGSPARWSIELGNYALPGPCRGGTFNGFPTDYCWIVDAAATPRPPGTAVFPTLTAALGGTNANQVILTGSATALVQGQIEYVATRQGTCVATTAPAQCNVAGTVLQFTVHDLRNSQGQPAPLSVAAGQIIQVTVTISFS